MYQEMQIRVSTTYSAKLYDSIFERQSDILMTEAGTINFLASHEEDLNDVGCNADLYAFKF